MKTPRLWLLVLLAFLLPVRGAMAAAMLCSVGSPGWQGEPHLEAPAHGALAHAEVHAHGHAEAHADHAGAAAHGEAAGHAATDHCQMCAAFCSMTPLSSELPRLPGARLMATLVFPDLSAPAPSFFSDGPERPPRST